MKKVILLIVGLIVLLIGAVVYFWMDRSDEELVPENTTTEILESEVMEEEDDGLTEIGTSTEGRVITAYHYGEGAKHVVFVGGIHGGYSWNTVLVAHELMKHLESNPEVIPENVRVTVIPTLNPDGLAKVVDTSGVFEPEDVSRSAAATIASRLNANNVDLNRNFDCDWAAEGTWQSRTVSGGREPFSEPESAAFRDFINAADPSAVVVWYSAAGGVFASSCHNDVLADTSELTRLFAEASGYRAYEEFDFYEITGDVVNWLAREQIPAISVLLSNHEDVEWDENRLGIEAILNHYANAE